MKRKFGGDDITHVHYFISQVLEKNCLDIIVYEIIITFMPNNNFTEDHVFLYNTKLCVPSYLKLIWTYIVYDQNVFINRKVSH